MTLTGLFRSPQDALTDVYVAWREASAAVHDAYERWARSDSDDRLLAFAGYTAALDQEEYAASVYERCIEPLCYSSRATANAGSMRALR